MVATECFNACSCIIGVSIPERHDADVADVRRCTHAAYEAIDHSVVELGLLVSTVNRRVRIVLLLPVVIPFDLLFNLPDRQLVLRAGVLI